MAPPHSLATVDRPHRWPAVPAGRIAVAGRSGGGRQRLARAHHQPIGQHVGRPGDHAAGGANATAASDAPGAARLHRRYRPADRGGVVRRCFQRRAALAQSWLHARPAFGDHEDRHAADARLVLPEARGAAAPARLRGGRIDPAGADGADRPAAGSRYRHSGLCRRLLRHLPRWPALEDHARPGVRRGGGGAAGLGLPARLPACPRS